MIQFDEKTGIFHLSNAKMSYVLQVIREACGSAEEYLAREYGLTPARRMRLRRMYLE